MVILNKKVLFLAFIFIVMPLFTYSHGNKKHNESYGKIKNKTGINKTVDVKESKPHVYDGRKPEGFIDYIFVKLPTFHPVVIHFPIILLIIAFPVYFVGVFFGKNDLKWFAIISCAGGLLGGIAAAYFFHPHTEGLPQNAAEVLKYHEQFADVTLILSGLAVLTGLITIILKLKKRMFEYIVLLLMILSIIAVSLTGHFGGSLVFLHGVGPQGKFLEMDKKH